VATGVAARTATKIDDLLVPMLRRAIKVFVVALGVVWIADNLDMDIAALLAGLGIGGIALALAGKETVENFFGALTILADRPFQVGDWIVMGNVEGTVSDVGFRATRVRTFYNSVITFPNAMLIRTAVDNLGAREYRRIKMRLGVTYDTPPDKLEAFIEGTRELIRRHPYTRKDYYHVYFNSFGDSGLEILLYCFVRTPDWATELRERHRLMMDILRLAGELKVEFAFPTRTLHMVQSELPDHGETTPDLKSAWRTGQGKAGEIVDRFTGRRVPPPVEIGRRPDEALDDGE
ncbi:MAG: mechanosensitive ion channel family protein, partial [Planctomycetota bacterium]